MGHKRPGPLDVRWRDALPDPVKRAARTLRRLRRIAEARVRFAIGVRPLAERWGQRGRIIHRHYLEDFLSRCHADIRGRVLEFQENSYTTRFGGDRVDSVDILNRESGRPETTIAADLTADNAVPSASFDCVICTYVLHLIYETERAIAELHRILKPGGTLLVAVPGITIDFPEFGEFWRFTARGLHRLLGEHFGEANVTVQPYGNSLIAAGEIRGLSLTDFTASELAHSDPRFALIICARAVKTTPIT